MKKEAFSTSSGSSLNTLAQTGTGDGSGAIGKQAIIVNGRGSDMKDGEVMKRKAKRKMVAQKLNFSLIDIAGKKKDTVRQKSYWNTFHCLNKIYTANGKMYGRYCKNRNCPLCCSIRKADIINHYLPIIATWPEPYFVTLTAVSVRKGILYKRIKNLNRAFSIITSRCRKRAQRDKGVKLVGVKSLECNFNPVKRTYNPHLHLIVATKEMAEIVISEWLKLFTAKFARHYAQNMQRVNSNEKVLMEVVKYSSKIFTEPDVTAKSNKKADRDLYAAALDNIFAAMKGNRIFDRFGFDLPKMEKESKATVLSQYDEWEFDPKQFDWLQINDEHSLTGYLPPNELLNLLAYNIDKILE